MTTLDNLDDAIQLMRDAGHETIPLPLDLAEYLLTAAFFLRAQQGQPVPPIRRTKEKSNVVRLSNHAAEGTGRARGFD